MAMFTSLSSRDRLLLFLLAVFVSLLYFQGTLYFTKGGLVFPTDDTYIYFQYARQFASGHPFQYNDGDPPSTGATSLLYLLVLTFFHLIGFRGDGLIYLAFFLGALLLALTVLLIYKLGEKLDSRAFALSFALLFLVNGGVTWGYLCGMEVALVSTCLLYTSDAADE